MALRKIAYAQQLPHYLHQFWHLTGDIARGFHGVVATVSFHNENGFGLHELLPAVSPGQARV